ncbi:MAG: asparagine synthase (glutamine-hydrolyzing) [Verrucomicrobia bacterium]|nr:asparagine synthase (glutamine-hydrolyzing) [Verrucomicrobiota bacterium]
MCGIAGAISLNADPVPELDKRLKVMSHLIRHRGPDGKKEWSHPSSRVGFAHRRLSIIDIDGGVQPMSDASGNWVTYNGEIYNYRELRTEIGAQHFKTHSDTEVILEGYQRWGKECMEHFRGMFSFAIWDEKRQTLICGRDRFGIKPFYYTVVNRVLYFASEAKALLPFVKHIETDLEGFRDYLSFQLCLGSKTLFKNIHELQPGHMLTVKGDVISEKRYWEVFYSRDTDHTSAYFKNHLNELLNDSVDFHLRSDVPVGAYVSGGLDSGAIAALASKHLPDTMMGFCGKFTHGPEFDESHHARLIARESGFPLHEVDIHAADFMNNIEKVIYHLDYPVAGPGSFAQFMVSNLASQHRKVVLGGQGGDETFGGYARYLIAYFEQCIKAAINGTSQSANFVVTYESIIPNLVTLQQYKPLLCEFWRQGLFEDMDRRYFQLINRAPHLGDEINWDALGEYSPFETFLGVFHGKNVRKESYFDLMTHFDFKTLLPALLHVEDRVSMAHGLEARVPLLDHPLVEFAATIPSDIKFKAGELKHIFRKSVQPVLPPQIYERKDKMGFPIPLTAWMAGEANDFVNDIFSSTAAQQRELIRNDVVLQQMGSESKFGRRVLGMLSLELWQRMFHDRESEFKGLMKLEMDKL